MEEITRIVKLLRRTFDKGAWHGPTVREVLSDISAEAALKKLPHTHSIIELVNHMTEWRRYTISKLKDDASFKVTEETNFRNTADWVRAMADLEASQSALIAAVEAFDPARLAELVPHTEHRYTFNTLLHGIIHHDLYHLGQIVFTKKNT